MVVALILLLFGVASAQTNEDARGLLQEIASSSRSAKSWRAEGIQVGEMTGRGIHIQHENRFKVAYQSPSKMLWENTTTNETTGGLDRSVPSGTLMVCDGTDHWTLNSPGNSFYHSSVAVSACKPEMGDFSKIADNLLSATLIGGDRVQFANALRECELVRAEYSVPVEAGNDSPAARSIRTLCIDPVQKLILRDHSERGNASDLLSVETTTYISYERDTGLPADLFQFQVPTGYFEDDGPQPDLMVENGVYRQSTQISAPTLISKIEPVYTSEALEDGVSGIVLVSFQVDSDGNPDKVKVVRGLGHGLDETAIETVHQWHFRPGTKDGVPVAVGPLKVAVRFRRP
jgi:TonB family protein